MAQKVVDIEYYQVKKLPVQLKKGAKADGIDLTKDGIIAVKTIISSAPSYEFEYVGKSHKSFRKHLHRLAREDGGNLNTVAENIVTR